MERHFFFAKKIAAQHDIKAPKGGGERKREEEKVSKATNTGDSVATGIKAQKWQRSDRKRASKIR